MDKSIVIYESAMCCSSGVCGPNPDQSLIQLQDTLEKVKAMGASVERYGITQNPKKFRENPDVIKLIQQQQIKALPITTFNGIVIKVGSYPGLDELKSCLQGSNTDSPQTAEGNAANESCCSDESINNADDCCSGQDSCDIRCGPNYIKLMGANNNDKCC